MIVKSKILIQSIFVFIVLLLFPGFANASYSGAFTDSVSTANVGSTFTTTFQVTNSSGTGSGSGTATLTIDSDYFSTSDSLAKTCSFNGASTCSVSWTLQAKKQGSQGWSALATIGSDSASGSHSSITINQVPTYSLTFTEDESDNTLSGGEAVTFSLSVTNNGGSAVTSALLEYDSDDFTLTLGSASTSLGTISQGGQAAASWKLTAKTPVASSSPQVTVTVSGGGVSSTQTITFTKGASGSVDSPTTPGGSSSSGGSGGGGASAGKDKKITHKPVPPGLVNNTKLQAAIEKVLAKGKLNQNAVDNLIRLSNEISGTSDISRTISTGTLKSNVTTKIKYTGTKVAKNYVVYEKVPKSFANSSDQITVSVSGAKVEVVEKDPEYAIIFDTVNPNQELSIVYAVSKSVSTSAVDSFATEVYADSLEEQKAPTQQPAQPNQPAEQQQTPTQQQDSLRPVRASSESGGINYTNLAIALVTLLILAGGYYFFKVKEHQQQ